MDEIEYLSDTFAYCIKLYVVCLLLAIMLYIATKYAEHKVKNQTLNKVIQEELKKRYG